MNRFLSWILVVIYLSASTKMLLPFAQDCVAHLFFLEQHIEQVHNNDAQANHLDEQLIEIIEQDSDHDPSPGPSSVLSEVNLALHCFNTDFLNDAELIIHSESFFFYHPLFHDNLWVEDVAPPPRQV